MTRTYSLLLATALSILPVAAFAQPAAQTASPAASMTKTDAPAKSVHAKIGTRTRAKPAKIAEPGKS